MPPTEPFTDPGLQDIVAREYLGWFRELGRLHAAGAGATGDIIGEEDVPPGWDNATLLAQMMHSVKQEALT